MTDPDPQPPEGEQVARAAQILLECYGDAALDQARLLEQFSSVRDFARAVTAEVERRSIQSPQAVPSNDPTDT